MPKRPNATSPNNLKGAELREEIVRLRKSGLSITKIAAEVGRARSTVHKQLTNALEEYQTTTAEEAEQLRALWGARYEEMIEGLWQMARVGDVAAVDRVVKIGGEVAKLHGLNAPQKIAPTTPDGAEAYEPPKSEAEIAERLREIFESAAARAPDSGRKS